MDLTSHQQRRHMETGPQLKISFERLEKRGIQKLERLSRENLSSPLFAIVKSRHVVMYKTLFVVNIILHMCLQHSNTS